MIAFLSGTIQSKDQGSVIVLTQQIGYQVFLPANSLSKVHPGEDVELFTHLAIRENAHELYGFFSGNECRFFEQLLTISGIGPKSAIAILSIASMEDIQRAIVHGDPGLLMRVSGIGKKTAERVIMELKSKITLPPDKIGVDQAVQAIVSNDEAIQALMSLGYTKPEAERAMADTDRTQSTEQKIKRALQKINS